MFSDPVREPRYRKCDASVGPAMPRIEVKIVNQDKDGRGEIAARGENIMLGYYRDPEATAAVLKEDGWSTRETAVIWINTEGFISPEELKT